MSLINKEVNEFSVQAFWNNQFKTVSKSDILGKWSVFFFYPADFTFVCPTELEDLAKALREKRKRLGAELDKRIIDELSYLDMNKVRFVTEISDLTRNGKRSYSDTGGDAVRFLISANVGEEPKPLAKIASDRVISPTT